jgi:co-chaperonin GroES (HSP10)
MVMAIKLVPVSGKVIVRLDSVEEKKYGSLIVSGYHSEPTRFGTIVAVGDDVKLFHPGQRVFMGYHVGNVVEHMDLGQFGDTLRIVGEGEIWGYVEEDSDGDLGLRPTEGGTETPPRPAN